MIFKRLASLLLLIVGAACSTEVKLVEATTYEFPSPVDTHSRETEKQARTEYHFKSHGITLDNKFDGARLNKATAENDSTILIEIRPENKPINPSPWYAFRLRGETERKIYLHLRYDGYKHRYSPKVSDDFLSWANLETQFQFNADSTEVTFPMMVNEKPKWIAAQEVVNSTMVINWCQKMAESKDVRYGVAGMATRGRPIPMLEISRGKSHGKPAIVILSRQHPPEVTGYFAMQSFLERIMEDDKLATEFRKTYRLLVFPLLNPDGVDEGHWRHNIGGVDLNRDWAQYNQVETKAVADKVVSEISAGKNKVILGLDFHSTWYDVYYTNSDVEGVEYANFKGKWLKYIQDKIPDYVLDERPSRLGQPVSKGWFYTQFKAVGITYEIGDDTPRDFIKQKGIVSAEGMMKLLLNRP